MWSACFASKSARSLSEIPNGSRTDDVDGGFDRGHFCSLRVHSTHLKRSVPFRTSNLSTRPGSVKWNATRVMASKTTGLGRRSGAGGSTRCTIRCVNASLPLKPAVPSFKANADKSVSGHFTHRRKMVTDGVVLVETAQFYFRSLHFYEHVLLVLVVSRSRSCGFWFG